MQGIILKWFVLSGAIMVAAYLVEGIEVGGFWSAFLTAAILGILNVFLRPVLLILTLPINILTLGLFTFVINALLLMMASGVIAGFNVRGFWPAVGGALIVSIVNWLISTALQRREGGRYVELKRGRNDKWE